LGEVVISGRAGVRGESGDGGGRWGKGMEALTYQRAAAYTSPGVGMHTNKSEGMHAGLGGWGAEGRAQGGRFGVALQPSETIPRLYLWPLPRCRAVRGSPKPTSFPFLPLRPSSPPTFPKMGEQQSALSSAGCVAPSA
jgi:hypothetical protein